MRTALTVAFVAAIVAQAAHPTRFQFLPFAVQVWFVVVFVMLRSLSCVVVV